MEALYGADWPERVLGPNGAKERGSAKAELKDEWTGDVEQSGAKRLLHFHQLESGPSGKQAIEFTWQCSDSTVQVGAKAESVSVWMCESATPVSWGPPGRPVPDYFRVPVRLSKAANPAGLRNVLDATFESGVGTATYESVPKEKDKKPAR